MNGKSLFLGFLTGACAAIVATSLGAPASGKETKRKLAENKQLITTELKDLKENLIKIKDSISTVSKEGKATISEFVHDVKFAIAEWKLSTEENKTELSKDLKEIEQTLEDLEKNLAKNHQN